MLHREAHSEADSELNCIFLAALEISECGPLGQGPWPRGDPPFLPAFGITCKQSSHNFKTPCGSAEHLKRSGKTLVGSTVLGHRLLRRFEKAGSGLRTTETSENPDSTLKTAHWHTDRQRTSRSRPRGWSNRKLPGGGDPRNGHVHRDYYFFRAAAATFIETTTFWGAQPTIATPTGGWGGTGPRGRGHR
eukprot:gene15089-biopygen18675